METINDRIFEIRRIFADGNNTKFAHLLGKKPNQTSNWVKPGGSIGETTIDLLIKTFPSIRREWLILGQLPKTKEESVDKPIDNLAEPNTTPDKENGRGTVQNIIDIQVSAGFGLGLEGDEHHVVDQVSIPGFSGCIGVMVYGDSMYDKYKPGDIVFVRRIYDKKDIDFGQCYIVITREDRLIKIIYESVNQDYHTLVSYNVEKGPDGRRKYPDREIAKEDIIFLYKVVGNLRRSQL
jgi:phage repressor protein C with HTH and peptisase S24 domain